MTRNKKWLKALCITVAALVIICAACLVIWKSVDWGFSREVSREEAELRQKYINTAIQWLGANGVDGSHKPIIDIYNAHTPLAQGYTVKYSDKWCATFVSTIAIQTGLTEIIPTECGCQRQISLFQALGRWEENDEYTPLPGDIIYYSNEGASSTQNTGWSDHVGIVCGTLGNCIKVMEGNVSGKAAIRYLLIDDAAIRGYGLPDYASASKP